MPTNKDVQPEALLKFLFPKTKNAMDVAERNVFNITGKPDIDEGINKAMLLPPDMRTPAQDSIVDIMLNRGKKK